MADNNIQILSNLLGQMDNINMLISQNKDLSPARLRNSFYDISIAIDELKKYPNINSIILEYYLLAPGLEYIISDQSSYDMEFLQKTLSSGEIDPCQNFQAMEELILANQFLPAQYSKVGIAPTESILYSNKILHTNAMPAPLYTIFAMDSKQIEGLLFSEKHEPSLMNYIVSYRGATLLSSFENPQEFDGKTFENGSTLIVNGSKQHVSSLYSDDYELTVTYFTDYRYYTAPIVKTMKDFIIMMSFIFVFGGAIVVLLSLANYRPINQIKNLLSSNSSSKSRKTGDFDFIIQQLNTLIDEHADMAKNEITNRRQLKNYCIFKILNSREIENDSTIQLLERLHISFKLERYICVFIGFNRSTDEGEIANAIEILKKNSLTQRNFECCYVINSQTANIIINLSSEGLEENLGKINNFCRTFAEEFDCHMGLGSVVDTLNEIHMSFKESNLAAEYAKSEDERGVVFYDKIELSEEIKRFYSVSFSNVLVSLTKNQNVKEIEKTLREMEGYITENKVPMFITKSIYYNIINTLFVTLGNSPQNKLNELIINFDSTFPPCDLPTLNKKIIEYCNFQLVKEDERGLIGKYMEYIRLNALDYNFSIQNMAEHFKISHQQMSNTFKRETSITLMEYVNDFRIKEALKLIVSTDLPVSSIVTKVGYIDGSSFTRKFKKVMGVTPIEYRNMHKQGQ